ncbi:glucose 1-dehydrogenase [Methylococcus sp. EFPC2]|uniref:glucose 1-dehydrogenase n=1 Tax=Methylococcus sp. EFPC2 TaxID=2812648 RepID=UPI0019680846|nr:glucose 1-dehydrogenase [Methylococcus sp. EFPC2]QSA95776.1 glucose 1-dehydrogenase [Methylococcus sp. EFPC2]
MNTQNRKRPLEGQRALVTGANTGIGAAVAEGLAAAGAKVLINYVSGRDKAEGLAGLIRAKDGEAIVFEADVSREDQVRAMFEAALDTWGSLDILVNNAGLQKDAPLVDMSLGDWEQVIRVNLTGQFLCAREAAKEFVRRGVQPGLSHSAGKIICMSSVHDTIPWAGHANYAASKGGVHMLMKTLAQELAMHKIRVNGIAPGAIKTPINVNAWATPEKEAQLLELIPYGRVGYSEDVAKAAVWLASDESDYVTGATLYVDGGMTLYPGFESGG